MAMIVQWTVTATLKLMIDQAWNARLGRLTLGLDVDVDVLGSTVGRRMHQSTQFETQNEKKFLRRGIPQTPLYSGEGTVSPPSDDVSTLKMYLSTSTKYSSNNVP